MLLFPEKIAIRSKIENIYKKIFGNKIVFVDEGGDKGAQLMRGWTRAATSVESGA